jgi:hypothetical protein
VSAFVVSSLFASLAGAVFAQILSFVGPGAFSLGLSLSLLVGIVLGGRSSLLGAIIGAFILVWLPEFVDGVLELFGDNFNEVNDSTELGKYRQALIEKLKAEGISDAENEFRECWSSEILHALTERTGHSWWQNATNVEKLTFVYQTVLFQ